MIAFIIILVIAAIILQEWSIKNALKGIKYDYGCSKMRVEPDEAFELVTTITNESSRFIPFLKLNEMLPKGIRVLHTNAHIKTDAQKNVRHIYSTWLMPRSKLERRIAVAMTKRGRFLFWGADITGGDFLGLDDRRETFHVFNEVVVYPKRADIHAVENMLGGFYGDISVRRFIIEDPVLTIGAKEYTGREPLKQISWKHSARSGRLMAKQFDYTAEMVVSVVLDISTIEIDERQRQLVECCYSLTRSVCESLEQRGISYDFISNAATANAMAKWEYIAEGLGKMHLLSILEGLGRAGYQPTGTFANMIGKMKREKNRSMIIITPSRDDEKHRLVRSTGIVKLMYGEDIVNDFYSGTQTDM